MDISSNVIIVDENTLQLTKDAKEGDIIFLNKIDSIDKSFVSKILSKEFDKEYKSRLNENLDIQKQKYENEISNLKTQISSFDKSKNLEIESLISKKDLEKTNDIQKLEKSFKEKIQELETQKIELNSQLKQIQDNLNLRIQNAINEANNSKMIEINKLQNDINSMKTQNELILAQELNKLKEEKDKIINDLKQENSKLTFTKDSTNIKKLGEQLEQWCLNEYQHYSIDGFKYCTFEKTTQNIKEEDEIKGTKPDFKFIVYLDDKKDVTLTSVCLEMKNESINSVHKKKNSDHYKKLDDDRRKQELEYALLVSELEWDSTNDAPIRKVQEYENMYVVRPQYFITFLSLLSTLANKYRTLITQKIKKDEKFKTKEELQMDFDKLKNTYLIKPLDSLVNEINNVIANSNEIKKLNDKNLFILHEIIDNKIEKFKEKIDRFDLKKINKGLSKLED